MSRLKPRCLDQKQQLEDSHLKAHAKREPFYEMIFFYKIWSV